MSSQRHHARHLPAGTYRLEKPPTPTPRNGEATGTDTLEARDHWVPPASGDDQPHPQLVAEAGQLPLGTVLVAGGGGDAIWLASHGWQVTAVGRSTAADTRTPVAAAAAGVGHRIRWLSADLTEQTPPAATFDLVCASDVQLPTCPPMPVHRRLPPAVRPGGFLLLIGQHPDDAAARPPETPGPELLLTAADLDPDRWQIIHADTRERIAAGPDGRPLIVEDTVLLAHRRQPTADPATRTSSGPTATSVRPPLLRPDRAAPTVR